MFQALCTFIVCVALLAAVIYGVILLAGINLILGIVSGVVAFIVIMIIILGIISANMMSGLF